MLRKRLRWWPWNTQGWGWGGPFLIQNQSRLTRKLVGIRGKYLITR